MSQKELQKSDLTAPFRATRQVCVQQHDSKLPHAGAQLSLLRGGCLPHHSHRTASLKFCTLPGYPAAEVWTQRRMHSGRIQISCSEGVAT